jgi:hypothetical protein
MTLNRPRLLGRAARLLWAGLGVVLLVFLGLSFVLSGRALKDAEADAQDRAEHYAASVLFTALTPDLVSGDILGPDYRDLLIQIQAGILSDPQVVQVRIWKPDGDLIFSTAQRDAIDEAVVADDPQIEQAAAGHTVSVITEATVSPRQGLQGSDEKLFETFEPIRLPDLSTIVGVVQINQRYDAIEDQANRIWRPVQIGLIVPLGAVAVLFGISLRAPAPEPEAGSATEPSAREVKRDDRKLRDAEERANAAERAAREVEARLADAERKVRESGTTGIPPDVAARLDELELKLRAEAAEREQFGSESQRLRAALAEKEAELAIAREPSPSTAGGVDDALKAAERMAKKSASRAAEAEARALDAMTRAQHAEGAASELEKRLSVAERQAAKAEKKGASSADGELAELKAKLAAAEAKLEESAKAAPAPKSRSRSRAAGGSADRVAELESQLASMESQRGTEVGDLQRAQEALANTQVELMDAKRRAKAAEDRARELEGAEPTASDRTPAPEREPDRGGREPAPSGEPSMEFASFASRLSSLRQELAEQLGTEDESASTPPEEPTEGLSLRERLARAAAARHRVPGGSSDD